MPQSQILRNRDFAVYDDTNDLPTSFGDWLIVPNAAGDVTKVSVGGTPAAQISYNNQFCGPHNPGYYPAPGTELTATLGASSIAFNYTNNDTYKPLIRIQIGSARYAITDTPGTQPKILAEWRPTSPAQPDLGAVVLTATVPQSYNPATDEPIYVVYWCNTGVSGTRPSFTVVAPSFTETVAAPPDTAPTAPTGLSATKTTTTATLTWTAGTDDIGVAGYNVYRDGVKVNTGLITATTFTDTGLTPNTAYTYTVRTVDTAGQESAASSALVVTTNAVPSDQPPTAPTGLAANKTTTTVTLSWVAGTDDHSVAGYRVYRDGTQVNSVAVAGTTYTDTGLVPNTAYSYTVRTEDNAGQLSAPTAALAVTTDALPPEPEPEPADDLAHRVADFLGASGDANLLAMAKESVLIITAMARAYTRGNGFDGTEPNGELAAVITTASARLVANPEQLQVDVGTVWTRSAFQGFNLAELFVLNRYRVRAQ